MERSQQVQQMGDIYRLATRVIAWVGIEADKSSQALQIMKRVGESIEVDWNDWCVTPKDNEWPLPLRKNEKFNALIMRPWFGRTLGAARDSSGVLPRCYNRLRFRSSPLGDFQDICLCSAKKTNSTGIIQIRT